MRRPNFLLFKLYGGGGGLSPLNTRLSIYLLSADDYYLFTASNLAQQICACIVLFAIYIYLIVSVVNIMLLVNTSIRDNDSLHSNVINTPIFYHNLCFLYIILKII